MNKKIYMTALAILAVLSLFYTGVAHDYWLSPGRFAIARGDTLIVNLLVGDQMDPEIERSLQKDMTKSFNLITSNGTIDLLPEIPDSTLPVLTRKLDVEGLALLSMERDFWNTKMTDEQFTRSLEHEEMQTSSNCAKKSAARKKNIGAMTGH